MAKQPRMPNMQQMMPQVQKMQQDMELAQEQLKTEIVEASAGGGMVTVKVSGDLRCARSRSTPRRSTRRTSRSSPTWCWRPSTRRVRKAQELAERKMGGATAGLDLGGLGGLGLPGL